MVLILNMCQYEDCGPDWIPLGSTIVSACIHWLFIELSINKPSKISITYFLILFTGPLPNELKIISVNYMTPSVYATVGVN